MDSAKEEKDVLVDSKIEKSNEWQVFWQKMLLSEKSCNFPLVPKKKVIVLAGATAVGKTELSLAVARALGGEIISADSMQIYRGMDIGTAKLPLLERKNIPHHLIDICDLDDNFNVIDFWREATRAIDAILARGRVPIIVGGTGFYIHALLYGPPTGPASVESVRKALEKELEEKGAMALFLQLKKQDPEYAATITANDKHKIVRALEVMSLTQKKVSHFSKQGREEQKYNMRCWFLHRPREVLYRRIAQRCIEMIEQGFLQEVNSLIGSGLRENSSASLAIGYRQALKFLDSSKNSEDLACFIAAFEQASRRYAKRQLTWFKKETLFRSLNVEELSLDRAAAIVLQDFELSL